MLKNPLPLPTDAYANVPNPYAAPGASSSAVIADASALGLRSFRVDVERERILIRRVLGVQAAVVFGTCALILATFYSILAGDLKRLSFAFSVAPPLAIATILAAYFAFLVTRFRKGLAAARSFVIEFGQGIVRRQAMGMPTVTLRREEVRSILRFSNGGFVLVGPTPQSSVPIPTTLIGRDDIFEEVRSWAPPTKWQSKLDSALLALFAVAFFVTVVVPATSLPGVGASVLVLGLSLRLAWKSWQSPLLALSRKLVVTIGTAWVVVNAVARIAWWAYHLNA